MQWARPDPAHLEKLIGLMQPDTPAHDLIVQLAPNGVERVKEALVSGLAVGQTPEKIGREVQDVLGGNMGRFLTVARTEDMRAYRASTHENFQANSDVVGQWRWMAALTYSTCAACLSLHGELFPLDEEMDSHPNCRCVPVPVVGGAPLEKWESGEEWLKRQSEDIQRRALGPAKLDAWKNGEISLSDLRGHSHNAVWGNGFHEVGLEKAKLNASSKTSSLKFPVQRGDRDAIVPTGVPPVKIGATAEETAANVEVHLREYYAKPDIIEKSFLVTKDNRLIESNTTEKERTVLSAKRGQYRDGIVLHSHPQDLPFSSHDLQTFFGGEVKQSVVVSSRHSYVLNKPDGWSNRYPTVTETSFKELHAQLFEERLQLKGFTPTEAGRLIEEMAQSSHRAEVFSDPVKETLLETTREIAGLFHVTFKIHRIR